MISNRLLEFDIAKGVAIIAVIIGHMGNSMVDRFVYVFHMPFFFLISGYFLSTKGDYVDFVKKKANGLIVPYVVSCIFIIILYLLVFYIWGYQARRDLVGWIVASLYGAAAKMMPPLDCIGYIGATWFLLALFWALCIIRYFSESKYFFYIICIVSFVGYYTAQTIQLPFSIQEGFLACFFVYIGFVCKRVDVLYKTPNIYIVMFLVLVVIWEVYFYKELKLANCTLGNGLMDVIAALSACYLVFKLCLWLKCNFVLSSLLSFYGRNSLIVLVFHNAEQNIVPWYMLRESLLSDLNYWLYFIIIISLKVLWSTFGIFVVLNIPFLTRLFRGQGISFNIIS